MVKGSTLNSEARKHCEWRIIWGGKRTSLPLKVLVHVVKFRESPASISTSSRTVGRQLQPTQTTNVHVTVHVEVLCALIHLFSSGAPRLICTKTFGIVRTISRSLPTLALVAFKRESESHTGGRPPIQAAGSR